MKYNCVDIGYENNKINAKISCYIFILYLDVFNFHFHKKILSIYTYIRKINDLVIFVPNFPTQ